MELESWPVELGPIAEMLPHPSTVDSETRDEVIKQLPPLVQALFAEWPAAESPVSFADVKWDVFLSHCKKEPGTEERCLWLVDVFEEANRSVFFDRTSLEEISEQQLVQDVRASKLIITVLDPHTFSSLGSARTSHSGSRQCAHSAVLRR